MESVLLSIIAQQNKSSSSSSSSSSLPSSSSLTITIWSIMDKQNYEQRRHQERVENGNQIHCTGNTFYQWVIQSMDDIVTRVQEITKQQEQNFNDLKIVIDLWILIAMSEMQWKELCSSLRTILLEATMTTRRSSKPTPTPLSSQLIITRSSLGHEQSYFNDSPHLLVPTHIEDKRIFMLLEQIGKILNYIKLDETQEIVNTFEQLSSLCPSVTRLVLSSIGGGNFMSYMTCQILSLSIQQLLQLQHISIQNLIFQRELRQQYQQSQRQTQEQNGNDDNYSENDHNDVQCSWVPLINAISQISTLLSYEFQHCLVFDKKISQSLLSLSPSNRHYSYRNCNRNNNSSNNNNMIPTNCNKLFEFVLTSNQIYRCDFYPRLNQAGYRQLLLTSSATTTTSNKNHNNSTNENNKYHDEKKDVVSEFVTATIAVHDRLDCIYHLICSMDPTILASAALLPKETKKEREKNSKDLNSDTTTLKTNHDETMRSCDDA